MTLKTYNKKRKFSDTPEPRGTKGGAGAKSLSFVVQKHDASHLHYDFRLEIAGAMKSWAIPKGPSLDPEIKRLAMQVEDHPISYNKFEGEIPQGNYGAGQVIVWDKGHFHSVRTANKSESEKEFLEGLKKGSLKFVLFGKKLKGEFHLFRFKKDNEWILMKAKDEFATKQEVTVDPRSVISKKMLIGKNEDKEKYLKLIKKNSHA